MRWAIRIGLDFVPATTSIARFRAPFLEQRLDIVRRLEGIVELRRSFHGAHHPTGGCLDPAH